MKVLINGQSLQAPLTGIGNYTRHLLQALQQLPSVSAVDCFFANQFFTAQHVLEQLQGEDADFVSRTAVQQAPVQSVKQLMRGVPLAYSARDWWLNRRFLQQAKQKKYHVYHEPNFILKDYGGPSIATVHDLSFIYYPEHHPAERVRWLQRKLPESLARADRILTDSERVKQELLQEYNVPAHKVQAIHLGVSERFRPQSLSHCADTLAAWRLRYKSYVLFVGTIEPRKGIATLLAAWLNLPKELQNEFPLVIAGAPGWKNTALLKQIQQLQLQHPIHLLPYVPDALLPSLYAGASVFAYPSVYEGFGLPVLEALASGVPVICGRHTAMAEFAQGARLVEKVDCIDEWQAHLQQLLEANQLLALIDCQQAQAFTWQRCAQRTAHVYGELS